MTSVRLRVSRMTNTDVVDAYIIVNRRDACLALHYTCRKKAEHWKMT